MFRLAVFFCVLILGMENGVLPGAAEIEYWKWIGVVLCSGRFVSVIYPAMGNRDRRLLSCPAVSELQPDFPGTNTPAVPDPRRLVLYRRAASETAGNDLSGDVLRNSNQL